jgi:hypothetical protein
VVATLLAMVYLGVAAAVVATAAARATSFMGFLGAGRDMGSSAPREFLLLPQASPHAPKKGRGIFFYTRKCQVNYLESCLGSGEILWGCLGVAGELGDCLGIEEMGQGDSFLWEMSARLIGETVALFGGSD